MSDSHISFSKAYINCLPSEFRVLSVVSSKEKLLPVNMFRCCETFFGDVTFSCVYFVGKV
jgi:hypothetical protein